MALFTKGLRLFFGVIRTPHIKASYTKVESCVSAFKFFSIESLSHSYNRTTPANFVVVSDAPKPAEANNAAAGHLKQIAQILNCSPKKVQMLCLKHEFLLEMSLDNLRERVELILSYDIPMSVIHTHLRAVWYVSTESLAQRLKLLEQHSLLDYKCAGFYLYCTRRELKRGLNYVSKNKEALGDCADQVEYLQQRLNIDEDDAKKFLSSTPFKRGYSHVRLKKQLDFFLYEAKVTSDYLLKNFILLNYSVERLRYRLEVMRNAGITDVHVMRKIWRFTPKEFNAALSNNFIGLE